MAIIIKFKEGQKQIWHLVKLQNLSTVLKSVLAVQLKELMNQVEDCEDESVSIGSVCVLQFLDDCYKAA